MRKLLALAALAVAAVAVAPAVTTADTPVEVVNEATGVHCDLAAMDCQAHMVSVDHVEVELHTILGHLHEADCDSEFTLTLDEDGSGTISGFRFIPEDLHCAEMVACNEPWPVFSEEIAPETLELETVACFTTRLTVCEGHLDMTLTDNHDHSYELTAVDQRIGTSMCEITGHWASESANFEINHL